MLIRRLSVEKVGNRHHLISYENSNDMVNTSTNIYCMTQMTPEREAALWTDAVFIFDTSAIGDLYILNTDSRDCLVEIFHHISDRCWIPAQVMYEYRMNRIKFINNPIGDCYSNPDFVNNKLVEQFTSFLNKVVQAPYYHPIVDAYKVAELVTLRDEISKQLCQAKEIIKEQFARQKDIIQQAKDEAKDSIFDAVSNMPQGASFTYSELTTIAHEGEFRFRNHIAPGYCDNTRKEGLQRYGDLIVWKEILRHASAERKPVIYICNDIKKGDYYELNDKKQPVTPRHELIREFVDVTGQDFWMYTMSDFLATMPKYLSNANFTPLFTGLDSVLLALELKEMEVSYKNDTLILCCNHCQNLRLQIP